MPSSLVDIILYLVYNGYILKRGGDYEPEHRAGQGDHLRIRGWCLQGGGVDNQAGAGFGVF